jgi:glutamine synthetase
MTPDNGQAPSEAEDFEVGALPETLKAWLRHHRIDEIDCAVPDIAGVARGKTMPAEKFVKLNPVHLPISIFHQTITGDYVGFEEDGQALLCRRTT